MIELNEKGLARNKYVKKEALKMLIIGTVFSFAYIVLTYISMSKFPDFFYVVAPLLLIMGILFFVVAPIKMLRIHNKTIKYINVLEKEIAFEVFSALWLESKSFCVSKEQVRVTKKVFYWYGKEKKEGYLLKLNNNLEYFLVSDYFTNNELLFKIFTSNNKSD